jgi:ribosomal protein S18 acetylase RimI-like enzyme
LRLARPEDAAFIRELAARAFDEFRPGSGEHTLQMAARSSSTTFVAALGARRAGFAVLDIRAQRASLDAIAVAEAFRGSGVGAALMQRVEAEARRAGAAELCSLTAESNVAALDLFTKHGLVLHGRPGWRYARGQITVSLQKPLGRDD